LELTYETKIEKIEPSGLVPVILYAKFTLLKDNNWMFNIIEETDTTIKIELRITGIVDFAGFNAKITYNQDVVTKESITNSLGSVINQLTEGQILFNYINSLNPRNSETLVLVVNFNKVGEGSLDLILTVSEMISIDENYFTYDVDYHITINTFSIDLEENSSQ
ncbi:MAG: hypothetical protein ACO3MF_04355, partial [Acholeplasmataceae bacterium]